MWTVKTVSEGGMHILKPEPEVYPELPATIRSMAANRLE